MTNALQLASPHWHRRPTTCGHASPDGASTPTPRTAPPYRVCSSTRTSAARAASYPSSNRRSGHASAPSSTHGSRRCSERRARPRACRVRSASSRTGVSAKDAPHTGRCSSPPTAHAAALLELHPDPIASGLRGELRRNGIASRFKTKRTDLRHQWLDPIVVAGPWLLTAAAGYTAFKRLRRRSPRDLRRGWTELPPLACHVGTLGQPRRLPGVPRRPPARRCRGATKRHALRSWSNLRPGEAAPSGIAKLPHLCDRAVSDRPASQHAGARSADADPLWSRGGSDGGHGVEAPTATASDGRSPPPPPT
jgi:hypothetical protein